MPIVNKRSVVLDLERPEDQERFRTLAAQSDVVREYRRSGQPGRPVASTSNSCRRFIRVWSGRLSRPLA